MDSVKVGSETLLGFRPPYWLRVALKPPRAGGSGGSEGTRQRFGTRRTVPPRPERTPPRGPGRRAFRAPPPAVGPASRCPGRSKARPRVPALPAAPRVRLLRTCRDCGPAPLDVVIEEGGDGTGGEASPLTRTRINCGDFL